MSQLGLAKVSIEWEQNRVPKKTFQNVRFASLRMFVTVKMMLQPKSRRLKFNGIFSLESEGGSQIDLHR